MCCRYALAASRGELIQEFGLQACPGDFPAGYNLSPFNFLPVVCQDADGRRTLHWQWWGLVPAWAEADHRVMHVNARLETLAKKPSFHDAYRLRRCIIPVSGFFEWPAEGLDQPPTYVQPVDSPLVGLAGVWEPWLGPAGDAVETFTILTVEANERLLPISGRMPVILDKSHYRRWLNPRTPPRQLRPLAHAYRPEKLLAYPVSPAVNSLGNDTPELIKPLNSAVI